MAVHQATSRLRTWLGVRAIARMGASTRSDTCIRPTSVRLRNRWHALLDELMDEVTGSRVTPPCSFCPTHHSSTFVATWGCFEGAKKVGTHVPIWPRGGPP